MLIHSVALRLILVPQFHQLKKQTVMLINLLLSKAINLIACLAVEKYLIVHYVSVLRITKYLKALTVSLDKQWKHRGNS